MTSEKFDEAKLSELFRGERTVLGYLNGIDGKSKLSHKELAKKFKVKVRQIRRVEERALAKLSSEKNELQK